MGDHILNDDLEGGFSSEGIPVYGEGDVPWRIWEVALAAAEKYRILLMVALAEHETEVVVLHVIGWAAEADVPGDEYGLRIGIAERL